jgi:hypothetical protein
MVTLILALLPMSRADGSAGTTVAARRGIGADVVRGKTGTPARNMRRFGVLK